MIPRIIHYCWFGDDPIPKVYKKYMATWRKYCPEYKIIKWTEHNYDVEKIAYVSEAFKARKFAFASDVARLDIIYKYGGIYLDTDVELLQSLNSLLKYHAFVGLEDNTYVNTGLGFGAERGNKIIKDLLELYKKRHFICNGKLNTTTTLLILNTYFKNQILLPCKHLQTLYNMVILPSEYLAPKSFNTGKINITKNTISIHHYSSSWVDNNYKKVIKKEQFIRRIMGIRFGNILLNSSFFNQF